MLIVLGVVAGLGLIIGAYNVLAATTYSNAQEAHLRKDCGDALRGYSRVAGFYALAFTTPRREAARRRDECSAVVDAQEASSRGDYRSAVSSFEAALQANPDSPIESTLERWHGEARVALADQLTDRAFRVADENLLSEAANIYRAVALKLDSTSVADRAASSLRRMASRLDDETKAHPCQATTYYSAFSSDFSSWVAGRLPRALYRCAQAHRAARRYGEAKRFFTRLIVDYPNDDLVDNARRGLIATEVAAIRSGRTGKLPDPTITGSSESNGLVLSIQNSSPYPLELLLSGPSTKRLVVPACTSCGKYESASEFKSCNGPTRSVTLRSGAYAAVVQSTTEHDVDSWSDDWTLAGGYRYDAGCFYIVTSSG